ncbi:hypothetical protein D3C78_1935960 [compost metagenome]
MQERVRRQSECLTGTLQAFLSQPPCQTLFRQIDTQRTLVAEAQRVVYGAILAHFVVGYIADEAAVICQTIGKH